MTAPQAIAAALSARGITSGRAQARLLGLDPSTWHAYRNGRSPGAGKLAMWCEAWGLRLMYAPGKGWVASLQATAPRVPSTADAAPRQVSDPGLPYQLQ